MTSNDPPSSAASGGRRRALGRGPGRAPAPDGDRLRPSPDPQDPSTGSPAPPAAAPAEPHERPAGPTAHEPGTAETSPAGREASSEPSIGRPVAPEASVAEQEVPARAPEPPPEAPGKPGSSTGPSVPSEALQTPAEAAQPPGHAREGGSDRAPVVPGRVAPAAPEATGADASGAADTVDDGVFKVRLSNFEGPFDLLLQLISKHKLDVTEVALSKVTDEFMAHIRAMGPDWDLDQTTEFLVVAATLLDLKAARLLPTAEVEDEADLALLEARDLLFARLLQYRAYKQIADIFNARLEEEGRRYPRTVGLEAHHAALLPEVVISVGPEGFARLAVKAMQPKPKPQVYVDHIHAPLVSVQEQAGIVVARLRELGEASFRALVEDTEDTLTVVARFLALLELYREKAVALDQEEALGDLMVRWTGGEGEDQPRVTDEFDRPPETADEGKGRVARKPEEPAEPEEETA